MQYDHIQIPDGGEAIAANTDHSLVVPDRPVIPCIEGDGIGVDVTPVMKAVVNAAVSKAYGEDRAVQWMQVYAGQAAADLYGNDDYLPEETLHALRRFVVSIKGPLTTPVGGGIPDRAENRRLLRAAGAHVCRGREPVRFPGAA